MANTALTAQRTLPLAPSGKPIQPRQWRPAALLADWLATRGSPTTRICYERDIRCLAGFLQCNSEQAAAALLEGKAQAELIVEHWMAWLAEVKNVATATRSRRLWAAQSFVKHARRREVVGYSIETPAPKHIPRRKTAGPHHSALDNILLDLATTDTPEAKRDAALIGLMYGCGLRFGETLSIRVIDCDTDRRQLGIVAKGRLGHLPKLRPSGEQRDPSQPQPDREILEGVPDCIWQLLEAHKQTLLGMWPGMDRTWPLWWQYGEDRMPLRITQRNSIMTMLKHTLADRGLPYSPPHGLRHASITKLLDKTNGNLRLAASFARHSDLRQLARYDDGKRGLFAQGAAVVADAIG